MGIERNQNINSSDSLRDVIAFQKRMLAESQEELRELLADKDADEIEIEAVTGTVEEYKREITRLQGLKCLADHPESRNASRKRSTRNPIKKMPGGSVKGCIKKKKGKVRDPGAYCASIADKIEPGWRRNKTMAKRRLTRNKGPKRNLSVSYKTSTPRGSSLPSSKTWMRAPTGTGKFRHTRSLGKGYTAVITEDPQLRLYTWRVKNSAGTTVASGTMSVGPITSRLARAKTAATSAGRKKLPKTSKKKTSKKKTSKKKTSKKKTSKKKTSKKKTSKKKTSKKKTAKRKTSKKKTSKKSSGKRDKCFTAAEWSKIQKLLRALKVTTKARKGDTSEIRARKARAAALLREQLRELKHAAACRLGVERARQAGQNIRAKCPAPPRAVHSSAVVLGVARAKSAGQKTKSTKALVNDFMKR